MIGSFAWTKMCQMSTNLKEKPSHISKHMWIRQRKFVFDGWMEFLANLVRAVG